MNNFPFKIITVVRLLTYKSGLVFYYFLNESNPKKQNEISESGVIYIKIISSKNNLRYSINGGNNGQTCYRSSHEELHRFAGNRLLPNKREMKRDWDVEITSINTKFAKNRKYERFKK